MYKELVLECSEGRAKIQIQELATLSEIQEAEKVVRYKFPEELKVLLLKMNGDKWLHEDNETRWVAKDMEEFIRRYYNSEI